MSHVFNSRPFKLVCDRCETDDEEADIQPMRGDGPWDFLCDCCRSDYGRWQYRNEPELNGER
jgi:hypothetical protein